MVPLLYRKAWKAPPPRYTRGYGAIFTQNVTQANEGCDFAVLARREQYGRVAVLYGSRTPGDLLFRKELKAWKGSFDLDVHVTVDRAGRDWRGNVGVVTPLVARVPFEAAGAAAFVCGPEAMMRFTLLELVRRGVPPTRIWLSLERNMKCGIGLCGHCQCGPKFVCRDGPVFSSPDVWDLMRRREA